MQRKKSGEKGHKNTAEPENLRLHSFPKMQYFFRSRTAVFVYGRLKQALQIMKAAAAPVSSICRNSAVASDTTAAVHNLTSCKIILDN